MVVVPNTLIEELVLFYGLIPNSRISCVNIALGFVLYVNRPPLRPLGEILTSLTYMVKSFNIS